MRDSLGRVTAMWRSPCTILLLVTLLAASCPLDVTFFVGNLSSRSIHVEYAVPCTPECPTPVLIALKQLRHDDTGFHGHQPAPARVQGRVDSLITYALELPPDSAVRLFDARTEFTGDVRDFEAVFPKVWVTVDS
jgi:hypothetical protein